MNYSNSIICLIHSVTGECKRDWNEAEWYHYSSLLSPHHYREAIFFFFGIRSCSLANDMWEMKQNSPFTFRHYDLKRVWFQKYINSVLLYQISADFLHFHSWRRQHMLTSSRIPSFRHPTSGFRNIRSTFIQFLMQTNIRFEPVRSIQKNHFDVGIDCNLQFNYW